MDVGNRITKLRTSKGWTEKQLADQVGVSAGTVKDWESGNSVPGDAKIEAIASALGVEADYLSAGSQTPQVDGKVSSSDENVVNAYGGYRVARDEMRMERDAMRYSGGRGSVIYAVYWIIIVLVYLAVSYLLDGWNWSWAIFVAAGAIFYPIMNSRRK